MTALPLVITRTGLARFTAAQLADDIDLTIATVGLTAQAFVPAPTLTALPGEHRRVDTVSGTVVGDATVHLTIRDDPGPAYVVRGVGLFLSDGTLFAVYGQADPIMAKSAQTALLLAIDLAFPVSGIDRLQFGDTDFLLPPASIDAKGLVELATEAEAEAGTPGPLVITASLLARAIRDLAAAFGQALDGIAGRTIYGSGLVKGGGDLTANRTLTVDAASTAEVRAGVRGDLVVTPTALKAAGGIFVVEQQLVGNGGYRAWSDGLKECWGSIAVPARSAVSVILPIAHTSFVAPAGAAGDIAQDEQMLGVSNVTTAGFQVRNANPIAATYYWHTKGV